MARLQRRNPGQSRIRNPVVVGPPVITPAPRLRLAEPYRAGSLNNRRKTHSALRAPAVVGPPVITARPKISFTTVARRFFHARSIVGRPDLTQPPVYIPARALLYRVRQPRRAQHAVWRLGQPVVAPGLIYAAPARSLAKHTRLGRVSRYYRWRPAAVDSAVLTPKPKTTIVTQSRRFQKFLSHIGVTILPEPVVYTPSRSPVFLVDQVRASRPPKSRLNAPIVVAPGLTYPRASQKLVARPRGAGGYHSAFRLPTVVDAFVPPPVPVPPPPSWSPFIDNDSNKDAYSAPELWYGQPRQRRKR